MERLDFFEGVYSVNGSFESVVFLNELLFQEIQIKRIIIDY